MNNQFIGYLFVFILLYCAILGGLMTIFTFMLGVQEAWLASRVTAAFFAFIMTATGDITINDLNDKDDGL